MNLRFLTAPQDMDHGGEQVQAGRVLEWIDRAGYACAVAWSASYCVTAYVGNVHYDGAIRAGDVVEVDARIIHTGRSSIHVLVSVHARPLQSAQYTRAMHCILVFVAVDQIGSPHPVRPWKPKTIDDRARQRLALERIPVRTRIKEAMLAEHYSQQGTAPRSTLRFIAGAEIANWAGNAHGGTVMRWIEEAARSCAKPLGPSGVRATYSGGIHFHRPISIGHIVEIEARAILVLGHDIHISVLVRSAPPEQPDQLALTTRCMMIFTSTDEHACLPTINERTAEDQRLAAHAREIINLRGELTTISDHLIRAAAEVPA
ncbi:4-hydroxybenzoyl-CoA thioesterase [Paenarthrobacter nicotinovorans]|uniref:hotdog domain-containing protein n=1 Tax=Paenarthrobacter nicotinovorans TaxID=29320 RepID=UPI0027827A0B|nr:hotdog domain-containing protein [Paenarthrobacter nicotinovorans]MDP9936812.1 4-hydroxybenzoyl-CoA thioesterase [Paenarthrobacter nicotinovorans]